MANTVDKLLDVAMAEVGYLEKKSNKNLNSKTANAGSNNYTKYGAYFGINGPDAYWCDMFVDWCFVQAYGRDVAKKLLHGFSAYTPTSAQYFKNNKQWHTTPQVGDQIFFKNSQRICHTGIVYAVTDEMVFTIEGNTSNGSSVIPNGGAVCKKSYSKGNSRIAGYGRPNYDKAKETSKAKAYGKVITKNDPLNMRKSASTKADVICKIPKGAKVEIIKKGSSWHKVKYNGKTGYCSATYIKI